MVIRTINEQDFEKLVSLYKIFFPTHNIFQGNKDVIVSYLQKEAKEREAFLVCEENNEIKGALILMLVKSQGTHSRWRFRHFAFEDMAIGESLLLEAEKRAKEFSETVKIELNIAETESEKGFYFSHGYEEEGALKNHYRFGETCFILGKSL